MKFKLKIKGSAVSTLLHFTRVKRPVEQCRAVRTPHVGLREDHLTQKGKENPKITIRNNVRYKNNVIPVSELPSLAGVL